MKMEKKDVNNSTGFYNYSHITTSPQNSSNSVTPPPSQTQSSTQSSTQITRPAPPSLLSQALATLQNTLLGTSKDNESNTLTHSPPLRVSSSAPPSPSLHNSTTVRRNNPLSLSSSEIAITVPVDVPSISYSNKKNGGESSEDVSCDSECGSWQMISESFGNKVAFSSIPSKVGSQSDDDELSKRKNDKNKLTLFGNPPVLDVQHGSSIHLKMEKSSEFLNIMQTKSSSSAWIENEGVFPQQDDTEENTLKKICEIQNIQDSNHEGSVSFEEMFVTDSRIEDDEDEEIMRIGSLSFTDFGSPQNPQPIKMNTPSQKLSNVDSPTVKIHAPIPTLPIYSNAELKNMTNDSTTPPPLHSQTRKDRLLLLRNLGLRFYNQHCIQASNNSGTTLWNIIKLFGH